MNKTSSASICFIVPSVYYLFVDPSKAQFTGVDLDLFMTGRNLAHTKTATVSYIVGNFGQPPIVTIDSITLIRSVGIENRSWLSGLKSVWVFYCALKQAGADIYITSGAGYEVGLFAMIAHLLGKKFIYRTASLIDCNRQWVKQHGFMGWLYEWGLQRADQIVTCAKNHVALLKQHYPLLSSCYIPTLYQPFAIKRTIPPFDILWVSTCYPLKRPEVVIRLAQALSDKKIIMIMPQSSQFIDYYQTVITQIHRQPNITLIKKVPLDEIDAYFAGTRVFINTSKYEGFPLAFLQALCQGIPSVFLSINPDTVLTRYQLGVWADDKEAKFVAEIRELLKENDLNKEYTSSAKRYIRTFHNPAAIKTEWQQLIKKLV